jgi:hypothetical protein
LIGETAHALKQTDFDALVVVGGTGCGRQDKAVETLVCFGSAPVHGIGLIPAETAAFGTATTPKQVSRELGRIAARRKAPDGSEEGTCTIKLNSSNLKIVPTLECGHKNSPTLVPSRMIPEFIRTGRR